MAILAIGILAAPKAGSRSTGFVPGGCGLTGGLLTHPVLAAVMALFMRFRPTGV